MNHLPTFIYTRVLFNITNMEKMWEMCSNVQVQSLVIHKNTKKYSKHN